MTSPLQSQFPWMLSRACGFGAFVAFTAVVVLGLLAASGLLRRLGSNRKPDVTALHRVLALIAWPLIAAHVIGAGTDVRHGVIRFAIVQVLVVLAVIVLVRIAVARLPARRVATSP